jgi:hypothetical protein
VGAAVHQEYWIPAEQLPDFNQAIRGPIEVDAGFFGDSFVGFVPDKCGFKGKNAREQFVILARSWDYSRMDFALEISVNRKAVYLNWAESDFAQQGVNAGLKAATLVGIRNSWTQSQIEPVLPAAFLAMIPQE